jgi:hypothetical protein
MTSMTMTNRHLISLVSAGTWLVLGCGAGHGPAGRPAPRPEAGEPRIDAGTETRMDADADAGRDAGTGTGSADARAAPAPAADAGVPVLARGVVRGTFIEIQEGDYFHIVIRDRAGSLQSFFIAPELPASAWEPFLTSRYRGKPVEITWDEVFVYIPEAGAEELIRRATGIRLIE